jgi:hypothetical protein
MKNLLTNRSGIIFTLVLVAGIIAGTSVSADGQWRNNRNWDGYPNWGGSYELRQTALNEGYNEGTKAGRNDRNRGRQSSMNDFSAYRNANKGYSSRYGDRELYRRYFQMAFENGYNTEMGIQRGGYGYGTGTGYGNNDRDPYWNNNRSNNRRGRNWGMYGNYGGSYELRQTALNAGYNDGNRQGKRDRDRNRPFNFYDQNDYRNATKDYNSRFGDRGMYQRYYREGYENGYSDAYNYGYVN